MPPAAPDARRERRRAAGALALTVPAPSIGVVAAMVLAPGATAGQVVFAACKLWMLLLPAVWRLRVDRRPISLSPARHGGLGVGALLGLAIAVVILAAYALVGERLIDEHHVREIARRTEIAGPVRFLVAAAFWICINSVIEEYVYRWFLFEKCEVLVGTRTAVVLSAAFFTIHHVIALRTQFDGLVTAIGSLGVFVGGLVWSWCYQRYRSIWPGYVSHAIVDVAVFWLGWKMIVQT
ncbi:MAG: CPBP family intramembrane glutamic endopeptidase [Planctomycetota bacterium]|jgi:membrane protease YdiL (CAAX protease family)